MEHRLLVPKSFQHFALIVASTQTSIQFTDFIVDGFIFFQLFVDNTTVILSDTKHALFVGQIPLCNAADYRLMHRPIRFLACVVINPLFVMGDELIQNFILALIFKPISACLNMSILICLSQLMQYPAVELVHQVYAIHSANNVHGTNV